MRRMGYAVSLVLLLILCPSGALAQSEAELAQARATFAEGVRLMGEQSWAEAAARFREVMQVRPTPQVKYNLGLALSHLEEHEVRQARRLLREASEDEALDEQTRASARARLEEIGPGEEADPFEAAPEPQPAQAGGRGGFDQPFTGSRPYTLEVHAGVSFWGIGFVTGARFGIPLVHNLVSSFNNALYLTLGVDFYWVRRDFAGYGPGVGVPAALHWEVYFDEQWSVFLELGAQFFVHPRTFENDRFDAYEPGYFLIAAGGVSWRVHENVAITLRIGTPTASFAGTFMF